MFSLVCGLPSTTYAGGNPLLFGCSAGTGPQYDSPLPCMRTYRASRSSPGPPTARGRQRGLPVLPRPEGTRFLRMPGVCDSAGPPAHSRCSCAVVWPSGRPTPWASWNTRFRSSILSLQVHLSNASGAASRLSSHGWGPGWFATPSLYGSCYSMPVYPGAIRTRASASPHSGGLIKQNAISNCASAP